MYCLRNMQRSFERIIFPLVKKIFEMLPTQNVWPYLSKHDNKIVWWNIGYSIVLYVAAPPSCFDFK